MSTTADDVYGPIDFVLLEFPADRLTGEAASALVDLVERGIIRVYDLLVIRKNEDGSVEGLEITDPSLTGMSEFTYFEGARSGLLGDEDVSEAAGAMEPNTVAALVVFENLWAIPFVRAARNQGAEVIASERIPAAVVMEALDMLEATS